MRTIYTLAVMSLTLLLSGCAAKPQDLIVGKWETNGLLGKVEYVEFSKDGSCSMPLPVIALRVDGKYRFADDDHIEVEFPNAPKPFKRKVTVTKETMTLTDEEQNKPQIYKRVK